MVGLVRQMRTGVERMLWFCELMVVLAVAAP